jgi:alpha-1,3-mannosyltransferase
LERPESQSAVGQLETVPGVRVLEQPDGFYCEAAHGGVIAFRARKDSECLQGEPSLFAKGLWHRGHGKIAVVPSVSVGYSDDATTRIKALKGYTSSHVARESNDILIGWDILPPEKVKCMFNYQQQFFVAWDEGLAH